MVKLIDINRVGKTLAAWSPNADCGPYGPKLRTGEGGLSDQLINIIVVQTEIQLLRCRRLGGGTAWHQPGCCCHDQDQHQQADDAVRAALMGLFQSAA